MRGVEKSPEQRQRGRYNCHDDRWERLNREKGPEKDPGRGVTGKDSPPLPPTTTTTATTSPLEITGTNTTGSKSTNFSTSKSLSSLPAGTPSISQDKHQTLSSSPLSLTIPHPLPPLLHPLSHLHRLPQTSPSSVSSHTLSQMVGSGDPSPSPHLENQDGSSKPLKPLHWVQ